MNKPNIALIVFSSVKLPGGGLTHMKGSVYLCVAQALFNLPHPPPAKDTIFTPDRSKLPTHYDGVFQFFHMALNGTSTARSISVPFLNISSEVKIKIRNSHH